MPSEQQDLPNPSCRHQGKQLIVRFPLASGFTFARSILSSSPINRLNHKARVFATKMITVNPKRKQGQANNEAKRHKSTLSDHDDDRPKYDTPTILTNQRPASTRTCTDIQTYGSTAPHQPGSSESSPRPADLCKYTCFSFALSIYLLLVPSAQL